MDLLTAQEVARMADLSVDTVRRDCRTGRLPAVYKGGIWLVRKDDAREYAGTRNPYDTLRKRAAGPHAEGPAARAATTHEEGSK